MKNWLLLATTTTCLALTACGGGGDDSGVQVNQPTNPNNGNPTNGGSSTNNGSANNGNSTTGGTSNGSVTVTIGGGSAGSTNSSTNKQIDGYATDIILATPETLMEEIKQGNKNPMEYVEYQGVLSSNKLDTVTIKDDIVSANGDIIPFDIAKFNIINDGKEHITVEDKNFAIIHRSMGYSYSRFGYVNPIGSRRYFFFHQGESTPYSNIPKGKATYKGVFLGLDGYKNQYKGTSLFEVDFAAHKFNKGLITITEGGRGTIEMSQGFVNLADRTVTTSATEQHRVVTTSGNKANEKNYVLTFTGSAKHNVTTADGKRQMIGVGTFSGKFYGKNANEMAGSYVQPVSNLNNSFQGSFGAKKQ